MMPYGEEEGACLVLGIGRRGAVDAIGAVGSSHCRCSSMEAGGKLEAIAKGRSHAENREVMGWQSESSVKQDRGGEGGRGAGCGELIDGVSGEKYSEPCKQGNEVSSAVSLTLMIYRNSNWNNPTVEQRLCKGGEGGEEK